MFGNAEWIESEVLSAEQTIAGCDVAQGGAVLGCIAGASARLLWR